jgi:hypothetical protein
MGKEKQTARKRTRGKAKTTGGVSVLRTLKTTSVLTATSTSTPSPELPESPTQPLTVETHILHKVLGNGGSLEVGRQGPDFVSLFS